MSIRLQESLRALFYAPFYVALARGASAAEGVEIEFVGSPRPQDAAMRLMDGSVDVCWGGPMWVMDLPDGSGLRHRELRRGGDARSLPAAGPAAQSGFALADLAGLRLATRS